MSENMGSEGFVISNISLSDGGVTSSDQDEIVSWEDVAVTDDPKYAEGLIVVETITKTSGWGGTAATGLGGKNAVKMLQKEAASKGCCLIVVTNVDSSFATKVTGTLYRRP